MLATQLEVAAHSQHLDPLEELLQKPLRLSEESSLTKDSGWVWDEEAIADIEAQVAIQPDDRECFEWRDFWYLPDRDTSLRCRRGPYHRGHCVWCGLKKP